MKTQITTTTLATRAPWAQHKSDGKAYASIRGANSETIADCGSRSDLQAQANAAFIVRACNAHDALVSALDKLASECQASRKYIVLSDDNGMEAYDSTALAIQRARAALSLASA